MPKPNVEPNIDAVRREVVPDQLEPVLNDYVDFSECPTQRFLGTFNNLNEVNEKFSTNEKGDFCVIDSYVYSWMSQINEWQILGSAVNYQEFLIDLNSTKVDTKEEVSSTQIPEKRYYADYTGYFKTFDDTVKIEPESEPTEKRYNCGYCSEECSYREDNYCKAYD